MQHLGKKSTCWSHQTNFHVESHCGGMASTALVKQRQPSIDRGVLRAGRALPLGGQLYFWAWQEDCFPKTSSYSRSQKMFILHRSVRSKEIPPITFYLVSWSVVRKTKLSRRWRGIHNSHQLWTTVQKKRMKNSAKSKIKPRRSASLRLREMEIQTTVGLHLTSALLNNTRPKTSWSTEWRLQKGRRDATCPTGSRLGTTVVTAHWPVGTVNTRGHPVKCRIVSPLCWAPETNTEYRWM